MVLSRDGEVQGYIFYIGSIFPLQWKSLKV